MILFRLLSAQPQTDGETWKISGRWHQDVWHADAYGQNPAPFQRNPNLSPRQGPPYPWRPFSSAWAFGSDAMFPFTPGFALDLNLSSYPAIVSASGATPVNTPQSSQPPVAPLQGMTANAGGVIKPGTYYIGVTANGMLGPVSVVLAVCVVPAGTNTNTITISGVTWPAGITAPNPSVYAGAGPLAMSYLGDSSSPFWTGSSPDANGNPTVFTITNVNGSVGLPDNIFDHYLIEGTAITMPGVFLDAVTGVSGAGSNVITLASGGAWSVNQWQNRILSLYYRPGVHPQPGLNMTVASNSAGALTMTTAFGLGPFQVGDTVVMRMQTSATANTITDPQLNLVADSMVGNMILILSGTGAGQGWKTIGSHTSGPGATLTINGTWDITPDATSVPIIVASGPGYQTPSSQVTNDGTASVFGAVAALAATVAQAQSLLVVVSTCDAQGNRFPARYQPMREVYVPSQNPGAGAPSTPYIVPVVAGVATPDASKDTNLLILTAANTSGSPPFLTIVKPANYATAAGTVSYWDLIIQQDPTTPSGNYSVVFDPTYGVQVTTATPNSPANTQCHVSLGTKPSGNSFLAGAPSVDQPIVT